MNRIALVEDEDLIRTMIKLNLELEGHRVCAFGDAEGLLESNSAGDDYDLILLDIMLPGVQGDEALAELRARGVHTPVMMLTAKGDVESKIGALHRGADDYLPKPFDVRELTARVEALLRRGAVQKEQL